MLIDFGGELVDSLRHTDWMVAPQGIFWSAKSLDDIQLSGHSSSTGINMAVLTGIPSCHH